jgi:hypothetical protein
LEISAKEFGLEKFDPRRYYFVVYAKEQEIEACFPIF